MTRSVIVSHPFGNPNSYNAALAFHEGKLLSCFHTCLYSPLHSRRRFHPGLADAPIRTHPGSELARLAMTVVASPRWNGRSPNMVDRIGTAFDRTVAKYISESDGAIYAYEDWAYHSFLKARDFGLATLYELPTSYFLEKATLLSRNVEREPDLKSYFPGLNEPEIKLIRKERELELAEVVICPSTFVLKSITGRVPINSRVHVIPYGVDTTVAPKIWQRDDFHRPLKLVYAGALVPQKGLHYLFQALDSLPFYSYTLTLAGRWISGYREWLDRRYQVHYEYIGHVPHHNLYDVYRANHVLVLPSICDGFGLILLEAMASGIPVIATDRTGAPDVLTHGREGFLVRAGSTEDLVKAIERCLDDTESLAEMGTLARRKAEELSWSAYRRRLIATLGRGAELACESVYN